MQFLIDGETRPFSGPIDVTALSSLNPGKEISATEDGEITVEPVEEGTTPIPTS